MMNQGRRSFRPGAHGWTALLAAAFVAGCGGGGSDAPLTPNEARLSAAQSGGLVAYFKAKVAQRAALGLNGTAVTVPTVGGVAVAGTVVANTGTSLLEAKVEEEDLLKTDGSMVYALHRAFTADNGTQPARLSALSRLADGSLKRIANVTLDPQYIPTGLYIANASARVAVLSQQDPYAGRQTGTGAQLAPEFSRKLSLDLFATGNGSVPAQTNRLRIDGLLVGSRMVGNTLYVVSTWSPDLTRFAVPAGTAAAAADAALAGLDTAALLPTLQIDGGPAQPLVAEASCHVPPANASLALQLTTITAIDLASASLTRNSRCFVGGSEGLYLAPASIYLASSRQYRYGNDVNSTVFPAASRTDIHKFALQGGAQVAYRGSASVAGHLGWDAGKMPQRMSEYQGDLRVLTFTGETGQSGAPPVTIQSKPASPSVLTVLRENAGDLSLTPLATLPNSQRTAPLARAGQQVDTLHFAGPRAYATSLLRTDPLYVLDLSSPADPKIAGEVAASAYSDNLVPLPNGLLLGIGKGDATVSGAAGGIQLALFDVRDPAQPRRLATDVLGVRGSLTALGGGRPVVDLLQQSQRVRVSFPARVYETPDGTTSPPVYGYQGAARYEVDTVAGTLVAQSLLASTALTSAGDMPELQTRYNLANERSLQIDSAIYYLSGGQTFFLVAN